MISIIITILAVLILLAAIPPAVRDTFETGRVYLFSAQFLEELPQRLTGPGRFRFVLQPLVATFLSAVRDLVAIAIVLDAVSQLLIYKQVHPGAALVVGPVLISIPYAVARALTNRVATLTRRDSG